MRILLVKTSSFGDVVHTFPALTDAMHAVPGLSVDWVVEEAFADIAAQHPAVSTVIPVAIRRWRKQLWRTWRSGEWTAFRQQLAARPWDLVIDAQGLVKSAFITRLVTAPRAGFDRDSAREPLSARVLDRPLSVPRDQHAITRLRQLFALALDYAAPAGAPDYGIAPLPVTDDGHAAPLFFFHGTTWATKHWPEASWRRLAELASAAGQPVVLPWGNETEQARAQRIAAGLALVSVLPAMGLSDLFAALRRGKGFVAVDTGLAHLAAAAGLPGVALYGPTDPALTGVWGARARSLAVSFPCAPCVQEKCSYAGASEGETWPPCFASLSPEMVWSSLQEVPG